LQVDARFMNGEHYRGHKGKRALALVCAALLAVALGALMAVHSHSHRSDLMTLDRDGTMRLGTVPLRNTNVRDAALTVVGHLNNGTVSFSATGAVTLSNIAGTMQAMRRAGITNVTIRSGGASATVGH
jgi:biopolymer transport protein ExbD